MIPISSSIENRTFQLIDLESKLKPLGYVIGGNWDYDHGYFDYKIADDHGSYQYLRVPFEAVDGQLDSNGTTVKLRQPFLLSHNYQEGLDDHAGTGVFSGTTDQFQEPQDPDAEYPPELVDMGKSLVNELEDILR
ncbi:YugN-like family protein [Bacillus sp. Marseille-P3661]|uniref:YugN-like family protein n=1 Tax=Bacillus sp. Marseille-P3661 TaxID=1936234 RepID=UPI000C845DD6|nr:YugN-like family protein [Bacillus sp. Marseille-P3661]